LTSIHLHEHFISAVSLDKKSSVKFRNLSGFGVLIWIRTPGGLHELQING